MKRLAAYAVSAFAIVAPNVVSAQSPAPKRAPMTASEAFVVSQCSQYARDGKDYQEAGLTAFAERSFLDAADCSYDIMRRADQRGLRELSDTAQIIGISMRACAANAKLGKACPK